MITTKILLDIRKTYQQGHNPLADKLIMPLLDALIERSEYDDEQRSKKGETYGGFRNQDSNSFN